MFFGDEKDIIIDSDADLQIADDGTVSWDDILDDGDELVSLKNPNNNNAASEQKQEVEIEDLSDDSLVDLGDELEFIDDEDDEVDDEELQKILTDDEDVSPKKRAFDAFGASEAAPEEEPLLQEDEEFDIDAQLANAAVSGAGISSKDNVFNNQKSERGEIKVGINPPRNNMPILIAILVAVLVGSGIYYYTSNFAQDDLAQIQDIQQQAVQEQMNNTTQEDIVNRNAENENIPVVNEEQLSELKAEKEDASDKKEVVPVVQTGRVDPFLPLGKYTTVVVEKKQKPIVIPQKVAQENFGFPKPPTVINNSDIAFIQPRILTSLSNFVVSGVMYDSKNPAAILNYGNSSYFVKIGDKVANFTVKDIQKNHIVLTYGKYSHKVYVREEMEQANNYKDGDGFVSFGSNRVYKDIIDRRNEREDENPGNHFEEGNFDNNNNFNNEGYVSPDEIEINERR